VGILTGRGGMTSHAALVARGWGKCCIVGAGTLDIDVVGKTIKADGRTFSEGDVLTLNGTRGLVYAGELAMVDATENPRFVDFMKLADEIRVMNVRTNAETPEDAGIAIEFGAEGIGLFRTEHMFYGTGSEEPLFLLRKMIMSGSESERRAALAELYPFVKRDMKATLDVMGERPVTIRLLDPPLHEFVPQSADERSKLAKALSIDASELDRRAEELHEMNPMMGHRGVRLGVTFPEITEMQIRAILEAAVELRQDDKPCFPEIMVPVTGMKAELEDQLAIAKRVHEHLYGTMIEIPRACLTAGEIAETVEFFSFGTNDLTQMTFGFSRDDIGGFLPDYLDKKILPVDPFQVFLKIGICGEHGGEPNSVEFCHMVGMDYVSCSPYRVPVARLAAAHAQINHPRN